MTLMAVAGCTSTPKKPPTLPAVKNFRLVHQLGGTHYRSLVRHDLWYQTFGSELLVIAPGEIEPMRAVEFGKPGEIGPAVDLVIVAGAESGERMFIVIHDDEVVELSLQTPKAPSVTNRISADALGIRPRRLREIDGEVYVSGRGGIVRLRDMKKIQDSADEDVSRIAKTGLGLAACIGRRAFKIEDGRFIGSASEIQSLGNDRLVFARQGESGVLAGLMTPDVREVDADRATVAVPGQFRSARVMNDRLWIVTDSAIAGYLIGEKTLSDPIHISVAGARDVSSFAGNYLNIAGTFGRCLYRINSDEKGPGETFVNVQREPSRLSQAVTDGRHILAGSREGLWMYLINSRVDLTARQFEATPPAPQISATVSGAQAKISEDRRRVTISWTGGAADAAGAIPPLEYSDPKGALLQCVVAVDGDFWLGHERGITVLKPTPLNPKPPKGSDAISGRVAGEIRVDGPVLYIYPLLVGGGASFVSEFGGFGVAQFVDEPINPQTR